MKFKEQSFFTEKPIWVKLRPESFLEFVDFASLGEIREKFLEKPFSFLLYGPPGIGKSTFIEILVKESKLPYIHLSSTEISLEDLRKFLSNQVKPVILVLEEIHRFSKNRQDFFLNPIEQGDVILLATTTESPWYYVSRALLSRFVVKEIHPPKRETFIEIVKNSSQKIFKNLENLPLERICEKAYPDFRLAFKAIEQLLPLWQKTTEEQIFREIDNFFSQNRPISKDVTAKEYDFLSAFIKSIRGSEPNAALLYLACLLELGTDPTLIGRRLVIFAAEDIGLANPEALLLAEAAFSAVEKIGMPEAQIILAQVVIYLAASPKSNSAYRAISLARKWVKGKEIYPPRHILNNDPKINEYKYPHDFQGFVLQNYWPENLPKVNFYEGTKNLPHFSFCKESQIVEQFEKLWQKDNS